MEDKRSIAVGSFVGSKIGMILLLVLSVVPHARRIFSLQVFWLQGHRVGVHIIRVSKHHPLNLRTSEASCADFVDYLLAQVLSGSFMNEAFKFR